MGSTIDATVADDAEPPLRGRENFRKMHRLQDAGTGVAGRIARFRETYFPDTTDGEWNDWHWQLAHRITTLHDISRYLQLTTEERQALMLSDTRFPFSLTPYYLSIIDLDDEASPLRKTVVPSIRESIVSTGESEDPLQEDRTSPVPGIVHRYPDRVLFLVTGFCSVYCRYCTRSRLVGGHSEPLEQYWEGALDYIEKNDAIEDVLISGGDPLTLCDEKIEWLLDRITSIDHVRMVRIGTKVPMVLPQRITPSLLAIFRKYKPLYVSVHCTHPDEITFDSIRAFDDLADAGVVMGSQTVLLKGVNDSAAVLTELYHRLLMVRVKPYYLFQCDPIIGSAHFRTTVAKGKEVMFGIRGFTSGYAVPQYVIDTPGGGGKVPILPEYEVGHDEDNLYLRNYEGKVFAYPDHR